MNIYIHMLSRFRFYLNRIEAYLPRNESRAGSRDIFCWERSYCLSMPRHFFAGFYFMLELKKTVLQHTLQSLLQSIITTPPPPSQPRYYLLTQLRIGESRKSSIIRRSGWGLLLQWRSEREMRISGKEKTEGWGSSWLACIIYHISIPSSSFLTFGC